MTVEAPARDQLLAKVMTYAADEGIAGRSLREIAQGVGTSHRMLLYHFGSREGLIAAIVAAIEAQQRAVLATIAAESAGPREVMLGLWEQLTRPELLPFVRLFFEVFGLVAQGMPGTEDLRHSLTQPWLEDAAVAAEQVGAVADVAEIRLGVAVSRGLLLDLVAGAPLAEVDAAYRRFVELHDAADAQDGRGTGRTIAGAGRHGRDEQP